MGKKKFVEKKKAVTFQVVHRSQRDPLMADPDAPAYVLKHVRAPNDKTDPTRREAVREQYGDYIDEEYGDSAPAPAASGPGLSKGKGRMSDADYDFDRREWELASYQLPTDGYDYSKHMREVTGEGVVLVAPDVEKANRQAERKKGSAIEFKDEAEEEETVVIGGIKMPKGAMPSTHEEKVGLLNRFAQGHALDQLKEDPDVVAQLFDFDDASTVSELDDDFVKLANKEGDFEDEEGSEGVYEEDEEEWDDYGSDEDDARSRGTLRRLDALSVTSSRAMLDQRVQDERFDRLLDQYDENEDGYGEDSDEECKGGADISEFDNVMDEFLESQKREQYTEELEKEKVLSILDKMDKDKKIQYIDDPATKKNQWDCETIVSTYSTLENHPRLIREPVSEDRKIKLSKKHGIPMGVLPERESKDRKLSDGSSEMRVNAGAARAKDESKEDKAARKKAVKEERRLARERKKQLKMDFKKEELKVSAAVSKANKAISGGIKL